MTKNKSYTIAEPPVRYELTPEQQIRIDFKKFNVDTAMISSGSQKKIKGDIYKNLRNRMSFKPEK